MTKRIIGIDLAVSAAHKAMVFDPACTQFIGGQITFRARPDNLDRLLHRARQGVPADVELIAILEATGMAWYPVAIYLENQGVAVYRVNGQKTKDFRRALWKHTGSDQIDGRVLALLYQIAPQRLSRCPLPDGDGLVLQRACRAYARWRELDVALQNRILAIDHCAWEGLHKFIPAEAQRWMRQRWYNPWRLQATGEAALVAAWTEAAADQEVATDWIGRWDSAGRADDPTLRLGTNGGL